MEHHIGYPRETIAIFAAVVIFSVWLDLRLHRDGKDISIANATAWSAVLDFSGDWLLFLHQDSPWR